MDSFIKQNQTVRKTRALWTIETIIPNKIFNLIKSNGYARDDQDDRSSRKIYRPSIIPEWSRRQK